MDPVALFKVELLPDGNIRFAAHGSDMLQLFGLLDVGRLKLEEQWKQQQQQARPGLMLPVGPLPPFNGGGR